MILKEMNCWKTWAEVRQAFIQAGKRAGWTINAQNYRRFIHTARLLHLTNL